MNEFAQLDGDHLVVLVVLAGIAAITIVGVARMMIHAFYRTSLNTDEHLRDAVDQLEKLVDHASDAYTQRELSSATLDRIAATLHEINEINESEVELLANGDDSAESINLALHPDLKPWPES